jgi:hypothetical protein
LIRLSQLPLDDRHDALRGRRLILLAGLAGLLLAANSTEYRVECWCVVSTTGVDDFSDMLQLVSEDDDRPTPFE